ncbi:MAG: ectonucleotide pyrophosphatase/phosphodiesterase [Sarcina sp.]
MQTQKYLIISLDAVDTKDFDYLSTLPHFKRILEKSSYSKEVQTIYPSLTYPAHTSIITGMYPNKHMIVNNIKIQPERATNSDWFWNKSEIKTDNLFDIAKRNKLICSSILWPVSCKANIKYNMPEVFSNRKWKSQTLVSALSGSIKYQLDLNNKFGSLRDGLKQPELDNFSSRCFLETLSNYKTDIMFLHLTDVDYNKHKFGCESKEAKYALMRHDERLGEIISKLEILEIKDSTTIVLLGDHSMLDAHSVIKPNKLFLDKCWLTLDKDKKCIKDYEVYANFCDGACYIYLKDKNNLNLLKKVKTKLLDFSEQNNNCIKDIYSNEEAAKLGADSNCSLMLEAKEGYYFSNDFTGDIIEKTKGKHDVATHGYHPNAYKNKTFFIVLSPLVKENFNMGQIRIIDIAPTIAKLLDESMPDIDGKCIRSIFK